VGEWLLRKVKWETRKEPYMVLPTIGEKEVQLRGGIAWIPPAEYCPDWLKNLTMLGARGEKIWVPAALERILPGKGKFPEKLGQLNEYFMEGQLKNFMVAMLALRMLPKTLKKPRILYVGSRAGEGSGRWLEVFALVALHLFEESIFVLMDPAEKNQEQIFMKEGRLVTYFRLGQKVTTDGSDYDLVIDDIFEPSRGTSRRRWKSEYWCVKVQNESNYDNIVNNCFHKIEGRAFSHPLVGSVARFTTCECAPCQIVDGMV